MARTKYIIGLMLVVVGGCMSVYGVLGSLIAILLKDPVVQFVVLLLVGIGVLAIGMRLIPKKAPVQDREAQIVP